MERRMHVMLSDKLMMALGVLIFCSPWLFGFANETTAALNAQIIGVLVFVLAIVETLVFRIWEEWIGAVAGAWMLIAPFVLGFNSLGTPTVVHFALGLLAIVCVVWSTTDHTFGSAEPH